MNQYKDTLIEELIRQKRTGREAFYKFGAVILAVIILFAVFLFINILFVVATGILALVLFFVFKYTIKEYEYSFFNGELDFDLIMGQRKRRTVLSVNCKQIRSFGDNQTEPERERFSRVLDASVSPKARMFFTALAGDNTEQLVFFNPSERLWNAMLEWIPKKVIN
jgi:hypothetical protein